MPFACPAVSRPSAKPVRHTKAIIHLIFELCANQSGQSSLPSSCPVCEHTPVAAEDCKPNKSLRTTIKVFLRTEEKKREALRSKEVKNSPTPTLLDVVANPIEGPAQPVTVEVKGPD